MANVGKNIKKLRTNCKMTQDTLAEQLFVSRQTVSNYENGKSNPDIDMLIKIAEIFGTDVNALIYGPQIPVERKVRKQEYIKLGIVAALFVLTGIGMFLYEKTGLGEWIARHYFYWPTRMMIMLIKPLGYMGIGWAAFQVAGIFFGAKRPKILQKKPAQICRRVLFGLLILYLAVEIPSLVWDGIDVLHCCWLDWKGIGYSVQHKIFPWGYFEFLSDVGYQLLIFNSKYNFIYFLPGIFFWASAPEKREEQKIENEQKSQ